MGKSKRIFEEERKRCLTDADKQALREEYLWVHGKEPKKENNDKCEK